MAKKEQYSAGPIEEELDGNGKCKHRLKLQSFRGERMPESFEFSVDEDSELAEGQQIGTSRMGQKLYWSQGMVIARG